MESPFNEIVSPDSSSSCGSRFTSHNNAMVTAVFEPFGAREGDDTIQTLFWREGASHNSNAARIEVNNVITFDTVDARRE